MEVGAGKKLMLAFPRAKASGIIVETINRTENITGLVVDQQDRLYALELPTGEAGTRKVGRLKGAGQIEYVVKGFVASMGMTIGPDSALYVSNFGATPPGLGHILRITVPQN